MPYIPFTLSFSKAFFSCFLNAILLEFSGMSNSQNYDAKIMMHYITAKKNSSQTIVQGGSP